MELCLQGEVHSLGLGHPTLTAPSTKCCLLSKTKTRSSRWASRTSCTLRSISTLLVLGVLNVCKRWTRDEYPKKRLEAEALMAPYTKAFELMLDYRTPLRLARMCDLRDKDKSVRRQRAARTRLANEFSEHVPEALRKHVAAVLEQRGGQRFIENASAAYQTELQSQKAPWHALLEDMFKAPTPYPPPLKRASPNRLPPRMPVFPRLYLLANVGPCR